MIRQGRSALRTTVVPVLLVRFKVDQTKAGNGIFFGARAKRSWRVALWMFRANNSRAGDST
ncbi:hypothetical protein AT5A_02545 [Agrobacterium tumefaciens 5A]|nr:hypothetical protein AT5A_02545 [Agrobacterium tumefaciens 5A]KQY45402.1 hypothetical protein ASD46_09805 [Rhizobium sp. Root491]